MTQGGWNKRDGGYDTSDLPLVLAELTKTAPPDAKVLELTRRAAGNRESGFFHRLIEEHFLNSPYPKRLKDVTKSVFGLPSQEDTNTWGQVADISIPAAVVANLPTILAAGGLPQMVHVSRDHPTTFTLIGVVDYGAGWTGNVAENIGVEIDYTVGIGQVKVVVKRILPVLTGANLFNGQQQVDVFITPLMALQATARIYDLTLSGVETPARSILVTTLAAPTVQ
jgi:hypothetical protein